MKNILAFYLVTLGVGLVVLWLKFPPQASGDQLALLAGFVTLILTMAKDAVSYLYGSSESSARKDDLLAASQPPATPTAPATPAAPAPGGAYATTLGTAAKSAIAILAILLLSTAPVFAQRKAEAQALPKPAFCDPLRLFPGCRVKTTDGSELTIDTVVENIKKDIDADLKYTRALAVKANTAGSKLRAQCLGAIIDFRAQISGIGLQNDDGTPMQQPDPHVIADLEKAAELRDALQSTGPLMAGCAAAANAQIQDTLALVNSFVTGAALKAATGGVF